MCEMDWKQIIAIVGAIVAVISLIFTAINTSRNSKINRARFWLDLRSQFRDHDEVHRHLRPGGDWTKKGGGPTDTKEWADVDAYLGLFEHCYTMLDEDLIDLSTFKDIYQYRLQNIVENDKIRIEKFAKEADYWKRFLRLLKLVDIRLPNY